MFESIIELDGNFVLVGPYSLVPLILLLSELKTFKLNQNVMVQKYLNSIYT